MKFEIGTEVKFTEDADLGDFRVSDDDVLTGVIIDIEVELSYPYKVKGLDENGNSIGIEWFSAPELVISKDSKDSLSKRVEDLESELEQAKQDLKEFKITEIEDNFEAGAVYNFNGSDTPIYLVVIQRGFKKDSYVLGGNDGNPFNLYSNVPLSRELTIAYIKNNNSTYVKTISEL